MMSGIDARDAAHLLQGCTVKSSRYLGHTKGCHLYKDDELIGSYSSWDELVHVVNSMLIIEGKEPYVKPEAGPERRTKQFRLPLRSGVSEL